MKEIKYLLNVLGIAAYTSSWWAAAIWGSSGLVFLRLLWVPPIFATILIAPFAVGYLMQHWDDDQKKGI